MKILFALAAAAGLQAAPAPTARDDAEAAMRATLVRAAQMYVNDHPEADRPCVRTEVTSVAFEPWRVTIRDQDATARRSPPKRLPGGGRVKEAFDWSVGGRSLTAVEAIPLTEALGIVRARAEPLPKLVGAIDPAWLPAGIKACPPKAHWRVLTFSSPTVVGDIAFVTTEYICPLCGRGGILALRRTASGWAPWAFELEWIS